MNDKNTFENDQEEPRKNFEQTIDAMVKLGVSTSNGEGLIKVNIYDYEEGLNVLDTIVIDKYNAMRLFGDLFVYSIDAEDSMLHYTLVAPPEK